MLLLLTVNAKRNPCPVGPAEFTPHPQGNFWGYCQRVVHDFSQSPNPRADLATARAAAPDGRVCGRFGAAQVQATPTLLRRLRWFVMALVLVVAQGLTAREALAQVRRVVPQAASRHKTSGHLPQYPESMIDGDIEPLPEKPHSSLRSNTPRTYAERIPTFQGGGIKELVTYIQKQVRWPKGTELVDAEGRVFASFTVGKDGIVRDAKIIKGLHPLLDAEALRIIKALTGFTAGRQDGEPVAVSITVPITFRRN